MTDPRPLPESHIATGSGATTFAGPDAVALYRARVLAASLRL